MKSMTIKSAIAAAFLATAVVASADTLSTYAATNNVFTTTGGFLTTNAGLPSVDLNAGGDLFVQNPAYIKLSPVAIPAFAAGQVAGGGGLLEFFYDSAGTQPFYSVTFSDSFFNFKADKSLNTFATGSGSVVVKDEFGNVIAPPAIPGFVGSYEDLSFNFSFSNKGVSSSYTLEGNPTYTPSQTVPEPFSMSLLACGAAAFVRRKLKK